MRLSTQAWLRWFNAIVAGDISTAVKELSRARALDRIETRIQAARRATSDTQKKLAGVLP